MRDHFCWLNRICCWLFHLKSPLCCFNFTFLNYINQLIALFGDGWATHRMWTSQGVLGPWAFCVESANSDASPDPRQWSTVAKMGERAVTTCYSGWLRNPAVDRWKTSHSFCWVSTCFNHRWCRISQPPTVWKLFGEAWDTYCTGYVSNKNGHYKTHLMTRPFRICVQFCDQLIHQMVPALVSSSAFWMRLTGSQDPNKIIIASGNGSAVKIASMWLLVAVFVQGLLGNPFVPWVLLIADCLEQACFRSRRFWTAVDFNRTCKRIRWIRGRAEIRIPQSVK